MLWAAARIAPVRSNAMARVEVVPASSTRIRSLRGFIRYCFRFPSREREGLGVGLRQGQFDCANDAFNVIKHVRVVEVQHAKAQVG